MTTARDIIATASYYAWHGTSSVPWEDQAPDVRAEYLRAADSVEVALRDAGLLPPDDARTLRDDLEFYVNDIRHQLPYLAPGGPREMAEQIAYDLQTLLDAQHTPTEETP